MRLESTSYTATEDNGSVEVCAVASSPTNSCATVFPFTVILSATDGSTGKKNTNCQCAHSYKWGHFYLQMYIIIQIKCKIQRDTV